MAWTRLTSWACALCLLVLAAGCGAARKDLRFEDTEAWRGTMTGDVNATLDFLLERVPGENMDAVRARIHAVSTHPVVAAMDLELTGTVADNQLRAQVTGEGVVTVTGTLSGELSDRTGVGTWRLYQLGPWRNLLGQWTASRPGSMDEDEAGREVPEGFRTMPWGINWRGVDTLYLLEGRSVHGDRVQYFARSDEEMSLGGVPASEISYGFYNSRFFEVRAAFATRDAPALLAIYSDKYGRPSSRYGEKGTLAVHIWEWPELRIVMELLSSGPSRLVYTYLPVGMKAEEYLARREREGI